MDEPTIEVKIALYEQRRELWVNSSYQFTIDAQVAMAIGDEQMKTVAAENIKRSIIALDTIDKMLAELRKGT